MAEISVKFDINQSHYSVGHTKAFNFKLRRDSGYLFRSRGPYAGVSNMPSPSPISVDYTEWPSKPKFYVLKITFSNYTSITELIWVN